LTVSGLKPLGKKKFGKKKNFSRENFLESLTTWLPNPSPEFQTLPNVLSKKSNILLEKPDATYFMEAVDKFLVFFIKIQELIELEKYAIKTMEKMLSRSLSNHEKSLIKN